MLIPKLTLLSIRGVQFIVGILLFSALVSLLVDPNPPPGVRVEIILLFCVCLAILIHIFVSAIFAAYRKPSYATAIGDLLSIGLLITTAFLSRRLTVQFLCSGWLSGLPAGHYAMKGQDGSLLRRDGTPLKLEEKPHCMALRGVFTCCFVICVLIFITFLLVTLGLRLSTKFDNSRRSLRESFWRENGRRCSRDIESPTPEKMRRSTTGTSGQDAESIFKVPYQFGPLPDPPPRASTIPQHYTAGP